MVLFFCPAMSAGQNGLCESACPVAPVDGTGVANSPQVFGLYADIDYECKKNPGPKRGIEKIIGPKTQKKLKQRARMPETKPNFKED